MIYLALPYSHPDAAIRESRFIAANRCAAFFAARGYYVFSPISHSHPIAIESGGLGTSWDYWRGYDLAMMRNCSRLSVLKLPGWKESVGVKAELEAAHEFGLPIRWLDPEYYVHDYFSLACAQLDAYSAIV